MSSGLKHLLFFVGGAAIGAVGLAMLNKNKIELGNKLNLGNVKPLAEDIINKCMIYKEDFIKFVDDAKENVEEIITEAKKNPDIQDSGKASESAENVTNSSAPNTP